MKNICFYFEIHQPIQLKKYRFFDIGNDHYYPDDFQTEEHIRQSVEQSYLPTNRIISDMIRSSNGKFKCTFSISGVVLEQLERYAPEVIDSFKELSNTGSIEFLAEPYAHSLASVYDIDEFERQVKIHSQKIEELFGRKPTALRNAELIYSNEIGDAVAKMGYKTMLMENVPAVMSWRSPNFVYNHSYIQRLKILVRNDKLSDDISFRFSDRTWSDYPLTAEKFISWVANTPENEQLFNIWMGYEAFGIFQRSETGIMDFLKAIPYHAMENGIEFTTPSQATKNIETFDQLDCPYPTSWSGGKDLSVWCGNDLQQEALNKLYAVSERVRLCKDRPLLHDWLLIQSSDHFRYMSHFDNFGSKYESPYEAFTNYMNILADFLMRVDAQYPTTIENEELNSLLKTINNQEKEIEKLEEDLKKARSRKK